MAKVISIVPAVEAANDNVPREVAADVPKVVSVRQKSLLAALALHKGVADTKSTMPALSNVCLRAADGVLTLRTTNLTEEITTVIPCGEGAINLGVSARYLHDAVKACAPVAKGKAEGPTIVLTQTENHSVVVSGVATFTVVGMSADDFPKAMEVDGDDPRLVTYNAAKLASALNFTLPAVSTDETRYHLCGILFKGDVMASTDGHRLHKAVGNPNVDGEFILPRKAGFTMVKLLKGAREVQATVGTKFAHFGFGDSELTVKLVDATFPPIEQVIPNRDYCDNGFKADRKAFIAALTAAGTMASDRTWGVKLNTSGGELYVEANGCDLGEAKAPFKGVARAAEPWRIGVNAKYLIEACAELSADEIELVNAGELDPMRVDDGDRTVVVMPMRI